MKKILFVLLCVLSGFVINACDNSKDDDDDVLNNNNGNSKGYWNVKYEVALVDSDDADRVAARGFYSTSPSDKISKLCYLDGTTVFTYVYNENPSYVLDASSILKCEPCDLPWSLETNVKKISGQKDPVYPIFYIRLDYNEDYWDRTFDLSEVEFVMKVYVDNKLYASKTFTTVGELYCIELLEDL